MAQNRKSAQEWLQREDRLDRQGRISRLEWLADNYPAGPNAFILNGGYLAMELLEQAKYSFAYGQFLATAVLGTIFIERTLAVRFYAAGRDDLERAAGNQLIEEALAHGLISSSEREALQSARRLRNPLVRFRRPLASDTLESRAVRESQHPNEVLEADAKCVLLAAFRVLGKGAV